MRKKERFILVVLISLLLILPVIFAQDEESSGGSEESAPPAAEEGAAPTEGGGEVGNPVQAPEAAPEAQQAQPGQDPLDVASHFKDAESATLSSPEGGKAIDITTGENGQTTVSGTGDFTLTITDQFGERTFEGFKPGEDNKLVFNEQNQLGAGTDITAGEKGSTVRVGLHDVPLSEEDKLSIDTEETKDGERQTATVTPKELFEKPTPAKIPKDIKEEDLSKYELNEDGTTIKYDMTEKGERDRALLDENNFKLPMEGTMYYRGNKGDGDFYYKKGEELKMGGPVTFADAKEESERENQGEWTRILTNSEKGVPENYDGSWMMIDQKENVMGIGTGNNEGTPIMNIPENNPVAPWKTDDPFARTLAFQAEGGEEPSGITLSKSEKDGEIPTIHMYGEGAKMDVDNKHLEIRENPKLKKSDLFLDVSGAKLVSEEDAKGTLTYPARIVYSKDAGENQFSLDGDEETFNDGKYDLYVNGHRQFATLPKDINWEKEQEVFQTDGEFSISPKLQYNYLQPAQQKFVDQAIHEKGATFNQLTNEGFFDLSPGKQQEFVSKLTNPLARGQNQQAQQTPLDLYGAEWCPGCGELEKYLKRNNIPYKKHNVDDPKVHEQLQQITNQGGIPALVGKDNKHIIGFLSEDKDSVNRLNAFIKQQQGPSGQTTQKPYTQKPLPNLNQFRGPQKRFSSKNYEVTSRNGNARMYAEAAEHWRRELSKEWLGEEFPSAEELGANKVKLSITERNLPSGIGQTVYQRNDKKFINPRIDVQGDQKNLVEATIKHETMHVLLRKKLGPKPPLWLEEGIGYSVEPESQKHITYAALKNTLEEGKRIPFSVLFTKTDYKGDFLSMQSQGLSAVDYLLTKGSKKQLLDFSQQYTQGLERGNNNAAADALRDHYGIQSIDKFEEEWHAFSRERIDRLPDFWKNVRVGQTL